MSDTEPFLAENAKKPTVSIKYSNFINIKNFFLIVIVAVFLLFAFSKTLTIKDLRTYSLDKLSTFQVNLIKDYFQSQNLSAIKQNNTILKRKNKTDNNCSPYDTKFQQYEAKIDSVKYPKSIPLYLNRTINFKCLNKSTEFKKILFWNPFFGDAGYSFGLGKQRPFVKNKCPVTTCEITNDKSLVQEADYVVVHMRDSIEDFPQQRPLNQQWIFLLYESPVHSGYFGKYNKLFNLTSTYRIDSDFPSFYEVDFRYEWAFNPDFNESKNFSYGKSELAAGVISNCGGTSKRLDYIKELQNYVAIDIFGKCGKACPSKFKNGQEGSCKEIIAKEYKFYFAFENSICKDYVTEKFFQILNYNIVPVVMGGGVYDYFVRFFY